MNRPLSFSQVSTWLRCGALYRFRYIDKAEPEHVSMALLQGSSIHDAVGSEAQRRLDGEDGGLDYALQTYRELLTQKVAYPEAPVELGKLSLIEHMEVGQRMLVTYFEVGPVERVVAVEKEFELDLGDGLKLIGVTDFVVEGENGPEVVELKTAARSWSDLQAKLSMQGAIYALALGRAENPAPVTFRVLTKTKVPKVQVIHVAHDRDSCRQAVDAIREVAGGIEAGCFPRNCSVQTCSGCGYFKKCQGRRFTTA